ncbi:MAG TPA: alpha-L-fucosidase [Acidobacteriaceae bacterium]
MKHLLACLTLFAASSALAQNFADMKPTPQQVAWQDMEMGAIIHFGTNTFLNREWGDGTALPSIFNPQHVDTDQWIEAAKSAGIRYVVLVAKHHDGFALYPTAQTDYSVKSSPWLNGKGDLVRMASDSARSHGLRFGVYLSPWDRHDPRYKEAAAYDKFYLAMLEELSSHYGELTEFWLDGAGSAGHTYDFDSIVNTLRTYQPNALVFADVGLFKYADIRWVGTESGKVDFENWSVVDRTGYLRWRPVEADTPLHTDHWFWHPNDEASLKSVEELVKEYDQTVGRGAQLMLGLAPDNTGLLPAADVARLKEFGARLHQIYGKNLALNRGFSVGTKAAFDGDLDTYWQASASSNGSNAPPILTVNFTQPATFDRTVTMERLNDGQHITEYRIEAEENGRWREIAHAQAVGHKKIDVFPAVTATAVRLTLLNSNGSAQIREFQVYNGAAPY